MMVIAAMEKAGSIDGAKVRDTLRDFEYKGLLQTYKFNDSGQSVVQININEVKGGSPAVVSTSRAT